jgi:flagellar hook-associated protein 2
MAGVSLGGLASGLNTDALVGQLMAIERQPLTRLDTSRFRAEGRKIAFDDLAVRLRGLTTARADLSSPALWKDTQKIESGDPSRVLVRKAPGETANLPAGEHTIAVKSLAVAQRSAFDYVQPQGNGASVTIDVGGVSVSTQGGQNTIADVAKAINDATTAPAYATVIDGNTIVLTAKETGKTFTATSNRFTTNTDPALTRAAAPAVYSVNGGPDQTSTSDRVTGTGVLAGLELDLRGVTLTGTPVKVTVGAAGKDVEAIKSKVKAFVDSYNSMIEYARAELTEAKVAAPKSALDGSKGALRGDSGVSGMLSNLRIALGTRADGVHPDRDTLAELGISVLAPSASVSKSDADRLSGKLVFDEAKLTAAIAANPDEVGRTFDAIGAKVSRIVEPFSRSGDGVLAGRSTQADAEATRIKRSYADLEQRLVKREERLRAYFTRLETSLQASQQQTSWLQGQIAGLGV